jgi:xanthine dehydrogenase accessory factor
MKADALQAIIEARDAKRECAFVTDLESGAEVMLANGKADGGLEIGDGLKAEVDAALAKGESRLVEDQGRRVFIKVLVPRHRLAIIGAGHISQYLTTIAGVAGFDVTVIDPRTLYASPERFPGATINHEWPDEALTELGLDRGCAVVALSHDPKLDEPALATALKSNAFYIGALGSRKTQAQRRERMKAEGFTDADLDRIHGPVGLDIGALSPAEIAVSIVAEMIDVLRPEKKGYGKA